TGCRSWPGRGTSCAAPQQAIEHRAAAGVAHGLDFGLACLAPLRSRAHTAKPELGDDARRLRVVDEVSAGETLVAEFFEAILHRRARGLGGEALAPPRPADPVADLGFLFVLFLDVADGTDDLAVVLQGTHELVAADGGDPQVGVDEGVGMR